MPFRREFLEERCLDNFQYQSLRAWSLGSTSLVPCCGCMVTQVRSLRHSSISLYFKPLCSSLFVEVALNPKPQRGFNKNALHSRLTGATLAYFGAEVVKVLSSVAVCPMSITNLTANPKLKSLQYLRKTWLTKPVVKLPHRP